MSDNIFGDYLNPEAIAAEEAGKNNENENVTYDLFSEDIPAGKAVDESEDPQNKKKDPEYNKLVNRSANAVLMKHIQTEELNNLKIENERVIFMKNAGKVAELKFMDFLYFGYMEKANLDLMKMVKKLKVRYEPLVSSEVLDEIIKTLSNEISYVLSSIKKKQKEELDGWKEGIQ